LPAAAAPGRAVPRRLRVERHLREELTRALSRLHDPRLSAVAITSVTLTDDLAFARVYVRAGFDGAGDPHHGQDQCGSGSTGTSVHGGRQNDPGLAL